MTRICESEWQSLGNGSAEADKGDTRDITIRTCAPGHAFRRRGASCWCAPSRRLRAHIACRRRRRPRAWELSRFEGRHVDPRRRLERRQHADSRRPGAASQSRHRARSMAQRSPMRPGSSRSIQIEGGRYVVELIGANGKVLTVGPRVRHRAGRDRRDVRPPGDQGPVVYSGSSATPPPPSRRPPPARASRRSRRSVAPALPADRTANSASHVRHAGTSRARLRPTSPSRPRRSCRRRRRSRSTCSIG